MNEHTALRLKEYPMSNMPRVYKWSEMPKECLRGGMLERTAVRTDGAVVTLNWFSADRPKVAPHSHPFDQLSLIVTGKVLMVIGDKEYVCEAGSAAYIPPNVPHTSIALGNEPQLMIDVFSPVRDDYKYLAVNQSDWAESSAE